VHELDCLEELRLEELVLFGNPVCMKYQDLNVCVSDMRKRLPQILKLDGVYISRLLMTDVNEGGSDVSL
jgi:hypothetical protein